MTSALHSTANPPEDVQASKVFETLQLEGLIPPGMFLLLNLEAGILTLVDVTVSPPCGIAQAWFTASEMCVLVPLLHNYPNYCPQEVMMASFNGGQGNVTQAAIEECRSRLYVAQANGTHDEEMRPVRNVLSRTRLKLHGFEIDIKSILLTGYLLHPHWKKRVLRKGSRERVSA